MKKLWNAIIALLVSWITPLEPGECQCSHPRCSHTAGKGRCHAMFCPDESDEKWRSCACQIFILDDDDDDDRGDDEEEPKTPSPEELERLYSR